MGDVQETAGSALRWARAALLAVVSLTLGSGAHASAGGRLPGAVTLLALLAVCMTVAAWLLGRQASRGQVVLLVVAGQTATHTALTLAAGHGAATKHGGHGRGDTAPDLAEHLLMELSGPGAVMAVAHLLAAVAVGLHLAAGEAALWGLLSFAGNHARQAVAADVLARSVRAVATTLSASLTVAVELVRASRCAARSRRTRPPRRRTATRSLVRRGPPLLSARG